MQVDELRQILIAKIHESAAKGDEQDVATVMSHARAALIALSHHSADGIVALQDLTVNTSTAALILGRHPEYVRYLIRQGHLPATKENGGFRIGLPIIADFMARGMQAKPPGIVSPLGLYEIWNIAQSFPVLGVGSAESRDD